MLSSSQRQLRDYGIFLGLLVFMFAVLFVLTIFSRKSWEDGLRSQVQNVLERECPGEYFVEDFVSINSPLSTSAACYKVSSNNGANARYAVILRVATIYGPEPAVFLCNDNSVAFIGFALSDLEVSKRIERAAEKSQLSYWSSELMRIFAEKEEGVQNEAE